MKILPGKFPLPQLKSPSGEGATQLELWLDQGQQIPSWIHAPKHLAYPLIQGCWVVCWLVALAPSLISPSLHSLPPLEPTLHPHELSGLFPFFGPVHLLTQPTMLYCPVKKIQHKSALYLHDPASHSNFLIIPNHAGRNNNNHSRRSWGRRRTIRSFILTFYALSFFWYRHCHHDWYLLLQVILHCNQLNPNFPSQPSLSFL